MKENENEAKMDGAAAFYAEKQKILADLINEEEKEILRRDLEQAEKEAREAKYIAYIALCMEENQKPMSHESRVELVSKSMAAAILMVSAIEVAFSTHMIDKTAEKLRNSLDLSSCTEEELKKMMESNQSLQESAAKRVMDMYKTPEKQADYIRDIRKLYKNMMEADDHSPEFKAMKNSVGRLASTKLTDATNPDYADRLIRDSFNMIRGINNFVQGRKRVLYSNAGKEQFDNAMDALSIATGYIPGVRAAAGRLVKSINHARGAENPMHKDHVNLNKFGAERAYKANQKRMSMQKNKVLEHKPELPTMR